MTGTQENWATPRPEEQTLVNINGQEVWIDNDFVVLIKELNRLGLITRSHCSGHESNNAWLVIRTNNVTTIEIRNWNEDYQEFVLKWTRELTDER